MIVAVAVVLVMQMAIHKVVHVIAVRNGLMPAVFAMLVICVMALAVMPVGTLFRILRGDFNLMLVDMSLVRRMQVAVVDVVNVVAMLYGRVATIFSMLVGMVLVDGVLLAHSFIFSLGDG